MPNVRCGLAAMDATATYCCDSSHQPTPPSFSSSSCLRQAMRLLGPRFKPAKHA